MTSNNAGYAQIFLEQRGALCSASEQYVTSLETPPLAAFLGSVGGWGMRGVSVATFVRPVFIMVSGARFP